MAQLDNPNLDLNDFHRGDFVEFLLHNKKHSFGIVTHVDTAKIDTRGIELVYYDGGFPGGMWIYPKEGTVKKSTKDEALSHFISVSESFKKEIREKGGLCGAIYARQQHQLKGVIDNLKLIPSPLDAIRAEVQPPMSGLYVIVGIYSEQGPMDYLESLLVTPRLPESKVTEVLGKIKPNGFGNIPSEILDPYTQSHCNLTEMYAFEVPENVTYLVSPKPTRTLKDLKTNWGFREVFPK